MTIERTADEGHHQHIVGDGNGGVGKLAQGGLLRFDRPLLKLKALFLFPFALGNSLNYPHILLDAAIGCAKTRTVSYSHAHV